MAEAGNQCGVTLNQIDLVVGSVGNPNERVSQDNWVNRWASGPPANRPSFRRSSDCPGERLFLAVCRSNAVISEQD
jgi:hypothetical protein